MQPEKTCNWYPLFQCKELALFDCFPVCEYLAAAFPETKTYELNEHRLLEGEIKPILEDLLQLAEQEDAQSSGASATDTLRHLETRLEGLFYAECPIADLPIGSGMTESGHRDVIQSRLKLPGSWWKRENTNAMAKIRAAKVNGEWDSLWTDKKAASPQSP